MMGELFASQLHHAIAREVYKGADPDDGGLRRATRRWATS